MEPILSKGQLNLYYELLLNGFQKVYEALFCLDLGKQECSLILCKEEYKKLLPCTMPYSTCLNIYLENRILPNYQKDFLEFTDIHTIRQRLEEKKNISMEYEVKDLGWVRTYFIPAIFDPEGTMTHILIAVESISEQVSWRNTMIHLSETDALTGLRNRYSGANKMKEIYENKLKGVFLYVDVDKFKNINDFCGHLIGDQLIKELALTLQNTFKEGVAFRMGGDEFGVYICGEYNSQKMKSIAATLFKNIDNIQIPEIRNAGFTLSISVGAVQFDGSQDIDYKEFFRIADQRLYESKKYKGNHMTFIESNLALPWYSK